MSRATFYAFATQHDLSTRQQAQLKNRLARDGKDWKDVDTDDLKDAAEEIGILLGAVRRFLRWVRFW